MTLSLSGYFRAALLALALAILGYLLASLFSDERAVAFGFALGLLLGTLLSPLLLLRGIATSQTQEQRPHPIKMDSPAAISQAPHPHHHHPQVEARTLYVGNLPYRANETAIRKLFSQHGEVLSVRLVKDKETGKRRGYGFVEMPVKDAEAAIIALNETEYLQRTLKVREANDKREAGSSEESESA